MKTNFLKKAAAAALIAGLGLGAASAGDKAESLNEWAELASKQVDKVMTYPSGAYRRGQAGLASFRVKVDRDGNVLDSQMLAKPRGAMIRNAAKSVIRRVDLPDLPAGYAGDTLTLRVDLQYDLFVPKTTGTPREGRVTSRQVAQNRGTGITILSEEAGE